MKDKILKFIKEWIEVYKYAPTIREICKGVGLSSTSSGHRYLHKLKSEGSIDFVKDTPRTITIKKVS